MKTVTLTDETYTALLSLRVIKEEEDPHKGFVVGKKYKHKTADIYAYYCGKNKYHNHCWELVKADDGVDIGHESIPKSWTCKGSGKYWLSGPIDHADFNPTPIEEAPVKELQPWEKFPTLESCWSDDEKSWDVCNDGEIYSTIPQKKYCYLYSTEAEAKKARATIFLSRIARKWNEGAKDKGWYYFPLKNGGNIEVDGFQEGGYLANTLPFRFLTKELAEKSLELFPEQWDDFYGR